MWQFSMVTASLNERSILILSSSRTQKVKIHRIQLKRKLLFLIWNQTVKAENEKFDVHEWSCEQRRTMQRISFNEITGLEIIWLEFLNDSHGEIVIRISPVIGLPRATVLLIQKHFRTPQFSRLLV